MGQVNATTTGTIAAAPEVVIAALSDYAQVRPAILPAKYSEYEVLEGGVGAGTVAKWRFQATKKRVRDVVVDVTVAPDGVVESDRNSTLSTAFQVSPSGSGSQVRITTAWEGATGIGGFFERTFAPIGLRKVHSEILANLAGRLIGS